MPGGARAICDCDTMRSMRLTLAFSLALLPALTPGCAEERVSLAGGPREYVATDYPEVLKRWTRSESLVDVTQLDNALTVTATFESWDFRWAYVIRYAQDYRLTVEQRRTLLEQTLRESTESHQFYVALYGSNWRWADLTRPNSAWIVRLIDDIGDETAPTEIEHIAKPGALERTYFPYTTVWRQVFRIRFPKIAERRPTIAPNAKWIGLRFAGAEGNEELRWDVDAAGAQRLAGPP
jgi:hypothetical protein